MLQIITNSSHREHACAQLAVNEQVYRALPMSVIAFVCFVWLLISHKLCTEYAKLKEFHVVAKFYPLSADR